MEDRRCDGELRAWLVRGGREGEREARALQEGLAIVGWNEVGDLGGVQTWSELSGELRSAYPDAARNVIGNWTGQLWRFTTEIQDGDLVVMPLKTKPGHHAIGRVTGPYEYRSAEPVGFRQVRTVDWIRWDIPTEVMRPDLRATLRSLLTVCRLTRNDAASRIAAVAADGADPGIDGEEEVTSSEELLDDAASRDPGNLRTLTIRNLLEHWGSERRTSAVIDVIKADLADKSLTTRPPFTEGSVSDEVTLVPVTPEPGAREETAEGTDDTEDVTDPQPMTLRLGSLPAPLISVPSTVTLTHAKTLMLKRQFSQLAVIDEDGTLHGAVSWESIGRAHIASVDPALKDAIAPALVVDHDALLLEQIRPIYEQGFVFVRNVDKHRVTGIITASDLTGQFGTLARPFVLVEEAENRLRRAADRVFSVEQLRDAVPQHQKSRVHQAADLTFGNYCYLLRDQRRWAALDWNVDHALFMELLEEVRRVRNDLMHFTTDELSGDKYDAVNGLLTLLRTVDPRP
ncbi:CBS domain-containing protein [Actinomadura bangladeshensis]|uniref:CBS domain-containing protein n=1 Tax=Actinomadura bangladeshensis TaxID=453573 RepID=A0A4R4P0V5_9ACTN|nr:CBS domain-containing protein [Actinomadura bangladeshensis]TDC15515.1 CBS domain-containing protein [Actinomadura bangladeshensis]